MKHVIGKEVIAKDARETEKERRETEKERRETEKEKQ